MDMILTENKLDCSCSSAESDTMSEPKMVSIRDLRGQKFIIPTYQRGFRWTTQQIDELLNDLCDFYKNNDRKIYCLQLITLRKIEDGQYEVIDGQQRLTVLWLLIHLRNSILPQDRKIDYDYSLSFEGKEAFAKTIENSVTILNKLQQQKMIRISEAFECYCAPDSDLREFEVLIEQFNLRARPFENLDLQPLKDIDSQYLLSAIIHILSEYKYEDEKDFYEIADKYLFREEYDSHDKDIQFIKYEMNITGASRAEESAKAISKFSNINANKIPLTESELIKAYFINAFCSNEAKRKGFVLKWEEIERKLNDDRFWKFFTNASDDELYETRIDFLFEVLLALNGADRPTRNNPHYLSTAFRDSIKKSLVEASAQWDNLIAVYDTLCDWYSDYLFYHMIGLIVEVSKKKSCQVIKTLYKEYTEPTGSIEHKEPTKTVFIKNLKNRICELELFKCINLNVDGNDLSISDTDNSVSYIGKDRQSIKPILLLYNIALLVNAYSSKTEETKEYADSFERFPFDFYKNRSNPIEIEHINPQHLNDKKDELADDQEIQEAIKCLDSITNLTLLDKSLNTSYKDKPFNEKRGHILAARYGLKYSGFDHNSSIIFPGTSWVFLRQYTDNSAGADLWTSRDREEYANSIKDAIKNFIGETESSSLIQGGDQ